MEGFGDGTVGGFAAALGVKPQLLSRWINNEKRPPSEATLERVAELTGYSVVWLRYGDQESPPQVPEDAKHITLSKEGLRRYFSRYAPPDRRERLRLIHSIENMIMSLSDGDLPDWWDEVRREAISGAPGADARSTRDVAGGKLAKGTPPKKAAQPRKRASGGGGS